MSQREAKDGNTLIVRRLSRRTAPAASVACAISCRAARRRSAIRAAPWRERHALAVPREKRRAHVILERAHLAAHRAMGEMQLFGRAGKALQPGGRLEGAQRGKGREASDHV